TKRKICYRTRSENLTKPNFKLRLTRNLSSADDKTGDRVDFEVLEEVRVKDLLHHSSARKIIVTHKGQYIWSVRWYRLIERAQLPKPTRPSLSHLHCTLRSPASTPASARTGRHTRRVEPLPIPAVLPVVSTPFRGRVL